jgi:periplasmic divalent cation tolerance protein
MTSIVEVTTTLETAEQAQSLAQQLVQRRLAACVQISGPVRSHYFWDEELCESEEYRCTIKSESRLIPELEQALRELHPYEVPEILVTQVVHCSQDYQVWLHNQLLRKE